MNAEPRARTGARWETGAVTLALGAIALTGLARAVELAWICDDAFLSLRYADNLVDGVGLVYNAGEYVEGYTNLLWTLLLAVAIGVGAPPVASSQILGIVFYAALAATLVKWSLWRARSAGRPFVPFAAAAVLAMDDYQVWATGGLETSLFTWLAVLGLILTRQGSGLAAGGVLSLLVLTRPDGVLFAGVAVLSHLASSDEPEAVGDRPARSKLALVARTAVPVVATLTLWASFKLWYYGELFPTAFYSKSVGDPYLGQGFLYVALLIEKNWFLVAAAAAAVIARAVGPLPERRDPRHDQIFLAAGVVFLAYLVHVGGDFMFARRALPALPLLLLVVEEQLARLLVPRCAAAIALGLVVAAHLPYPIYSGSELRIGGIADEPRFYPREVIHQRRLQAEAVSAALSDTPARVAFDGGMCVFGYYSHLPYLVEVTGLTQYSVAKRPIGARGHIGHEKLADIQWLTDNQIHFLVRQDFPPLALERKPRRDTEVVFGGITRAQIVVYSDEVMDRLRRRRDVEFTPIERIVARRRRMIEAARRPQAEAIYAELDRFYLRNAGVRGAQWARELRNLIDAKIGAG